MARVAGIDFGLKRIGIAVSDAGKTIAFPVGVVPGGAKAIQEIKKALGSKLSEIDEIVIGLPLLLSGKEGDMSNAAKLFGKKLEEELKIPIRWIDERFSSKLADRSLREIHLKRKERTEILDTTAAVMLLQSYLNEKHLRNHS